MTLPPDTRVHDREALDEIELYGELIIAAAASDGPLRPEDIDAVLGVGPGPEPKPEESTESPTHDGPV